MSLLESANGNLHFMIVSTINIGILKHYTTGFPTSRDSDSVTSGRDWKNGFPASSLRAAAASDCASLQITLCKPLSWEFTVYFDLLNKYFINRHYGHKCARLKTTETQIQHVRWSPDVAGVSSETRDTTMCILGKESAMDRWISASHFSSPLMETHCFPRNETM